MKTMDCVTCKHLVVGDKDLVCGVTNTVIPKEYTCDNFIDEHNIKLPEKDKVVLVYIGSRDVPLIGKIGLFDVWWFHDSIENEWYELPNALRVVKWKEF